MSSLLFEAITLRWVAQMNKDLYCCCCCCCCCRCWFGCLRCSVAVFFFFLIHPIQFYFTVVCKSKTRAPIIIRTHYFGVYLCLHDRESIHWFIDFYLSPAPRNYFQFKKNKRKNQQKGKKKK